MHRRSYYSGERRASRRAGEGLAGIGGLNGNAASGMLIGAGIGGLIDAMGD
jgi:hypothetical protein